jgi:glycosyltransferase involved in cell wall biosynthesis
MKRDITIIIPAYNEEGGIRDTIIRCIRYNPEAVILVVDDCSKDGTNRIVRGLQEKHGQVALIRNETNKNYGGALKVGFENCSTDYLAFLDADSTYDPKYIPPLLEMVKAGDLDCAWGSRFGREKSSMPLVRKIGNLALIALFALCTFKYIPDTSSGLRLFSKDAIRRIDFSTLPDGLDMITAMSKRTVARKLKFDVLSIQYSKREGNSKLNIVFDFLRMSKNIVFEK